MSLSQFEEAKKKAADIIAKLQKEGPTAGVKRSAEQEPIPGNNVVPKKPALDDEMDANLKAIRHGMDGGLSGGPPPFLQPPSDRKPGLGFGGPPGGGGPDIPKLGDGPPLLQGVIRNGEKYLDMMIQGSKVGLIIGKGGETIRSLQDRAGVKVTIYQQINDPSEVEKQLRIIGDPDKVDRCKDMILDILADKDGNRGGGQMINRPGMDRHNEYGSNDRFGGGMGGGDRRPGPGFMGGNTVEVAVPPNFIGLVIGKGGESIKRIQAESGTKVQFDSNRTDSRGNKICSISGPPDCVRRAEEMIQEIIDTGASNQRSGGGNRFVGGHEVRYPVPANRCGAVIGRGGDTIRQIKAQSGCDIELDKMSKMPGGDEKVFIIRGPPDRIPFAQQLINDKVRERNSNQEPQTDSNAFGSQSGDYSFNAYIQAQHGIPPAPIDATAAQSETLNYYAQYYAAIAAQQAGGDGPHQQQHGNGSNAQPGPPAGVSTPGGGGGGGGGDGQDYTQQWIEYYRAYGMHKEADQIEAMARSSRPGQSSHEGNGNDSKPSVSYPGFNYPK